MKVQLIFLFPLILSACGPNNSNQKNMANLDSLDKIYTMEINHPVKDAGLEGRQAFWLVRIGDDDKKDRYKLFPPPKKGDIVSVMAAMEDNSHPDVRVSLNHAKTGETLAEFNLATDTPYIHVTYEAQLILEVTRAEELPQIEVLIGARIINVPKTKPKNNKFTFTLPIPKDETAPVPELVKTKK